MKRFFPWIVLILAAVSFLASWQPPSAKPGAFDFVAFGKLPVLADGRVKPLDTVGRVALVILRGRQTVRMEEGESSRTLEASQWLADVLFNSAAADKYPAFAIHNPEVLGLFGWQQDNRKYFSYAEIAPFLQKIDEQARQAESVESAQRSPFQTGVINLRNALIVYQRLKQGLQPEDARDFSGEIEAFTQAVGPGMTAMRQREKGEKFDQAKFDLLLQFTARYKDLAETSSILPVPPAPGATGSNAQWTSVGAALAATIGGAPVSPAVKAYALIGDAYRANDPELFNRHVADLAAWIGGLQPDTVKRATFEHRFNFIAPFYQAMTLYVLVFLLVCASWLGWNQPLNRAAFLLLAFALLVHSFGLGARMYLQGRPPVTNLYSSAIFIGWGTAVVGLVLERIFKEGIGAACAALVGFVTLIIAHHLASTGDTLEMLRAVLDTNIWLATHVVTVTLGYSAMFLAGMLAVFYIVRGVFTTSLTREAALGLTRMTYGVICFATLFSFVGTVLGGIWADQSWGRFWGWDPKENGALLIVLWCAVILHARWGGYIRQRGLMVLALFGNIITSFSWFGVNMLGVGLHSYGFMDKAFPWLLAFVVSQLALMAIATLPLSRWRSFREETSASSAIASKR